MFLFSIEIKWIHLCFNLYFIGWFIFFSYNLCYGSQPNETCWRLQCALRHIWVSDTNTDKRQRERKTAVSVRQNTWRQLKKSWNRKGQMVQTLDKEAMRRCRHPQRLKTLKAFMTRLQLPNVPEEQPPKSPLHFSNSLWTLRLFSKA